MTRRKFLAWLPEISVPEAVALGKRLAPWVLMLGMTIGGTGLVSCKQDKSHQTSEANGAELRAILVQVGAVRTDLQNLASLVREDHAEVIQRFRDNEAWIREVERLAASRGKAETHD